MAESVRLAVETGVAGLSIEDTSGNSANPIFDVETAVRRLRAARAAIDQAGAETLLVGRAENFIVGRRDLPDTLARLKACADAGADRFYAPGIRTRNEVSRVGSAVAPKPVNVLVGGRVISPSTVSARSSCGVSRWAARCAWAGLLRAAATFAEGRFDEFATAASGQELNALFRAE